LKTIKKDKKFHLYKTSERQGKIRDYLGENFKDPMQAFFFSCNQRNIPPKNIGFVKGNPT
jgi:hypothetical protein